MFLLLALIENIILILILHRMEITERSRRKKRKKRLKALFFFIIILGFIVFLIYRIGSLGKANLILSPLAESVEIINETMKNPIQKIAEKKLFAENIKYGIVVKNLKTGEGYYYNDNEKFQTASLYKLWAMAAAFEKLSSGQLDENEVLSEKVEDINANFNIASEEAELTEGEVTRTVKDAIDKMITISDNYSALLLVSRIRNASLASFLKNYGFNNSNTGSPPQSTAGDIAMFFEKLYKGEIGSKKDSEEMMEILKRQTFKDRIPKYLPDNISIAHKTGELGGAKHDAGIVFAKKGDYIIVVLTDSNNPVKTAEKIARFSEEVYKHFE